MRVSENFIQELKNISYPKKEDFKTFNVYKKGKVLFNDISFSKLYSECLFLLNKSSWADVNNYNMIKLLRKEGYIIENDFYQEEYNTAVREYHSKANDIFNQFKEELFRKYQIISSPRSEFLWSRCWEEGHSSGLSEIENVFENWVDILTL